MTIPPRNRPWSVIRSQRGSYFAISAVALLVIFGFAALGVEAGRWYAVQGELAKSIDGAAFAGAANVNNPNIPDLNLFVQQVAQANFADGLLGTDTAQFVVTPDGNGKITVSGSTNALNTLAKGYNPAYDKTHVATTGSARLRNAEIALVLDTSGSMGGDIGELKDAAKGFVDNFKDQEDTSKFALINFSSGVLKPFDLDYGYFSGGLETKITSLQADGSTNAEEALSQAAALPWKDQSSIPPNEQDKQVLVFFSDGNPTAFRGDFKYKNNTYDAVASIFSNVDVVMDYLQYHDEQFQAYSFNTVNRTGDGKHKSASACGSGAGHTVKWEIFSDPTYGLDSFGPTVGIDPEQCLIGEPDPLADYTKYIVRQMALDNAQAIKDNQGIEIYTIGLGDVDQDYLKQISSGEGFYYWTADATELEGIFQQIANIMKLVLVS